MPDYYDRQGRPIDLMEWSRRFSTSERIVMSDQVGPYRVSTIWLGLDHAVFGGLPLIFETMIFVDDVPGAHAVDFQERYSTEEGAIAGHNEAVSRARQWQEEAVNHAKDCAICDH